MCASDSVCVRAVFASVRVCVRLRARVGVCVRAFASVCVRMHVRVRLRVRVRLTSVCVRLRGCVCVRLCAHARVCARVLRACVCVCGLSACAFAGVRVAVLLRGALGMISLCWRDIKGTRRVLEGPRGVLEGTPGHSRGTHRLMGCTLGYLGGFPIKRLRACVAVHLLGCIPHTRGGARHGTGALGELAPPEGYSTSTHVGP